MNIIHMCTHIYNIHVLTCIYFKNRSADSSSKNKTKVKNKKNYSFLSH